MKYSKCRSDNITTERRINGYHICEKCGYQWQIGSNPKTTDFKVGDTVKITSTGQTHDTYPVEELTKDIDIIRRFCYGKLPNKEDKYQIIAKHPFPNPTTKYELCLIQQSPQSPIYLVNTKGLEKK